MAHPADDPAFVHQVWLYGVSAIMALLAWIGNRQIKRIDKLEGQALTRQELETHVKYLGERIDTGFNHLGSRLDDHMHDAHRRRGDPSD